MEQNDIPDSWEEAASAEAARATEQSRLQAQAEALLQNVRASQAAVEVEIAKLEGPPTLTETSPAVAPPPTRRPTPPSIADVAPFLLLVDIQKFAALLLAHGDAGLADSLRHPGKRGLQAVAETTTSRLIAAMTGSSDPLEASPPVGADSESDVGSLAFGEGGSGSLRSLVLEYGCGSGSSLPELLSSCRVAAAGAWVVAPARAFCAAAEALFGAGVAFHAHEGSATFDAQAVASAASPSEGGVRRLVLCLRYPLTLAGDVDGGGVPAAALARELGDPWQGGHDRAVAAVDALRRLIEGAHRDVLWKAALWRAVRHLAATEAAAGAEGEGSSAWWDLPPAHAAASPLVRLLPPLLDRQLPQPPPPPPLDLEGEGAAGEEWDEDALDAAKRTAAAAALHAAAAASAGADGSAPGAPPAPWVGSAAWEAAALLDAWVDAFGRLPPPPVSTDTQLNAGGIAGGAISSSAASHTDSGAAARARSSLPVPASPPLADASEGPPAAEHSAPGPRPPLEAGVGPSLDDMKRGVFAVRAPRFGGVGGHSGAASGWGPSVPPS